MKTEGAGPVGEIEQREEHFECVGPKRPGIRAQEKAQCENNAEHEDERWRQPQDASHPEVAERDSPRRVALLEQDRRDEEAAEDEEDVHAEKPTWQARLIAMKD